MAMQEKINEILMSAQGWMTAAKIADIGGWRSAANVGVALQQMEKANGSVERRKSHTEKMSNGMPATEWKLVENKFDEPVLDPISRRAPERKASTPVVKKSLTTDQSLQQHATEVAVKHYNRAEDLTAELDDIKAKLALAEKQRDEHFERAEQAERANDRWVAFAGESECKSIPELRVFIGSLEHQIHNLQKSDYALREQLAGQPVDAEFFPKQEAAGYLVRVPGKKPRICIKPESARNAALSGARQHGRADVLALVPVGKAVRGAEWKEAEAA
jgi:hypothetical protein